MRGEEEMEGYESGRSIEVCCGPEVQNGVLCISAWRSLSAWRCQNFSVPFSRFPRDLTFGVALCKFRRGVVIPISGWRSLAQGSCGKWHNATLSERHAEI